MPTEYRPPKRKADITGVEWLVLTAIIVSGLAALVVSGSSLDLSYFSVLPHN
ncbi:hypothetical protein SJ05684_c10820 [Sinorhizobium sojae CCBAU 05684]|uniref:Uncharacterized protein n=1 Tax=Sinorhizobium sojae CCBAU 05684 TaxID=716928 RepID=A0A249PB82_9HYPH|nr:hypothetical protein [Sinorhizobium sojae]ASY62539.1 hypothetical protein SJ05684_c10820 [Sinorhizobium sojae CCBAU 05684]